MSKCKNCNCICHCSLEEHSDPYGVCPCQTCSCNSDTIVDDPNKNNNGLVLDDINECESCQ